ncbi:MAG: hypothetical protein A2046_03455 [Bacteroidetes bacterium GWA2_30_7]|nr:MAG: hypothetical protein A2046_03455 [Bacteroidetes bacterium GWA2_30_7]
MSFKNSIKDYLSFTKSERNGIIVLISIIIILIVTLNFDYLFVTTSKYDFSQFEKEINDFEKSVEKPIVKIDTVFNFNPNNVSEEEMLLLGFSPKISKTIIKIRSKSFKFYKKEDLLKIYGFDTLLFNKLQPYIVLQDTIYQTNYNKFTSEVKSSNIKQEVNLAEFNPNELTYNQCISLGLSSKQANIIVNYLEKGGRFKKKEDLKKIYSITESDYNTLEPYIVIENQPTQAEYKTVKNVLIEINSADSIALIGISGIGTSYAKRILKYRSMLGGYNKIEQLKEVYGMTDELFSKISTKFTIDVSKIKKININKATYKEMISHPYFGKDLTKGIDDVRKFNGNFNSIEELIKFKLIDKEKFEKIKDYISV